MVRNNKIILIGGPTASGKSQMALSTAGQHKNSVIINADSMQVYDALPILSACPRLQDRQEIPHYLYGFVNPQTHFSVGHWLECVIDLLRHPDFEQKTLIFVGGTGLYFRALGGSLAQSPQIPENIRQFWREKLIHEGAAYLHAILVVRDPSMAHKLQPNDGQRIIRALEVLEATGQSLKFWQAKKSPPLLDLSTARKILIMPDRHQLYARIDTRVDNMIKDGALEEVQALLMRELDKNLPAMKAIGVGQLTAYLQGLMDKETAIALIKQETRRYAKRQLSWFRNQSGSGWHIETNI